MTKGYSLADRRKRMCDLAPKRLADFLADARELVAKLDNGNASSADIAEFLTQGGKAQIAWEQVGRNFKMEPIWKREPTS